MDFYAIPSESEYVRFHFVSERPKDIGFTEPVFHVESGPSATHDPGPDLRENIRKETVKYCGSMCPEYEDNDITHFFIGHSYSNGIRTICVIVLMIPVWSPRENKEPSVELVKKNDFLPIEGAVRHTSNCLFGYTKTYFPNDLVARQINLNLEGRISINYAYFYEPGSYKKERERRKNRVRSTAKSWIAKKRFPRSISETLIRTIVSCMGASKTWYLSVNSDESGLETTLRFLSVIKLITKRINKKRKVKFFKELTDMSENELQIVRTWARQKINTKTKKRIRLIILLSRRILILKRKSK